VLTFHFRQALAGGNIRRSHLRRVPSLERWFAPVALEDEPGMVAVTVAGGSEGPFLLRFGVGDELVLAAAGVVAVGDVVDGRGLGACLFIDFLRIRTLLACSIAACFLRSF